MRINYNISALIAKNALNNNDSRLSASTLRLSSGYKINSSKDDAAGLAIARKMSMQIKSIERASRNADDGVSVVNTADGAMNEMHSILQRLNELSVQAANGTNSDTDRSQIQLEVDELVDEIDRIADTTQFNAQNLLDGTFAFKGYTNSENVKIMSYNENVSKGTYIINSIEYYTYGNEEITYTNGQTEVVTGTDYRIKSADSVKDELNMSDNDEYGIKGFPAGSKVTIDDEYLYVKDDNGFEMKLYVNDRQNVTAATTSTVTVSNNLTLNSLISTTSVPNNVTVTTKTYSHLIATDDEGTQVTISTLITREEDGNISVYSDARNESYDSLESTLGIENITDVRISQTDQSKFTVYYEDSAGKTQTKEYTLEYDATANQNKTLDDYLSSTGIRQRTDYTVGDASNPITINITKMGAMLVQTGANEGQQLAIEIPALNAINLGVNGLSVSTEDDATNAIDIVSDAINQLSAVRSKIGAYSNRLEHTIANLDTADENLTSAYSNIMDVDMAEEMTEYSSMQVLVEAATSVLAQANERPQQVLQLLQ